MRCAISPMAKNRPPGIAYRKKLRISRHASRKSAAAPAEVEVAEGDSACACLISGAYTYSASTDKRSARQDGGLAMSALNWLSGCERLGNRLDILDLPQVLT